MDKVSITICICICICTKCPYLYTAACGGDKISIQKVHSPHIFSLRMLSRCVSHSLLIIPQVSETLRFLNKTSLYVLLTSLCIVCIWLDNLKLKPFPAASNISSHWWIGMIRYDQAQQITTILFTKPPYRSING